MEPQHGVLLLLAGFSLYLALSNHQRILLDIQRHRGRGRGRRRWWVRPVNQSRNHQGFHDNLLREALLTDHEEFYGTVRMWPEQFNFVHNLIRPRLEKSVTVMREPLSTRLRLALTLKYLAQGGSIQSLHEEFRVGRSTVHQIIGETCKAIWDTLQPIFMPQITQNQWEEISNGFFERWNLPNCVGAMDGRHMRIKAPPLSGSQFYNYKGFFSVVLLAVLDSAYKFICVDVGQYGSVSDGGVWANSEFGKALEKGEVDLPVDTPLPGTDVPFPYYIVGDEAFPLRRYLMRPYPGKQWERLPDNERIFNHRLSRARRVSENAFGILTSRWQVLHAALSCSVQKAEIIIKALVCLHNMLMDKGDYNRYINPGCLDVEREDGCVQGGQWRQQAVDTYFQRLTRVGANRAARTAIGMRNHLADYLSSDIGTAQAPWQYERAFRGAQLIMPD